MPLTGVTVMALKAAAKVIPFCMLSRGRSQTSPQGPHSGALAPGHGAHWTTRLPALCGGDAGASESGC